MESKKQLIISNSEWTSLRNGFAKKDDKMPYLLSVTKPPTKKYCEYYVEPPRPKSKANIKNIQDFIHNAKKMVAQEKFVPFNLKRAMMLSDVFTEKKNQLRFQKALKKMEKEMEQKENLKFDQQLENYRMEQLKKTEADLNAKIMLGKRLKNEILELRTKKSVEKVEQIEKEKEAILKNNHQWEEEEANMKRKAVESKRAIDKMHQEDLLAKSKQFEAFKRLENEEYEIAEVQRKLLDEMNQRRNSNLKSIRVKIPPKTDLHRFPPEKEFIKRCYDLPLVKKSTLEEKRELYSKNLKKDRIKGYETQMKKIFKRKTSDQYDRKIEYKRRCENIKVTDLFKQLKHHHVLEKIKEYRNIWNHQLVEKKQTEDRNKQEDVERREKLLQKIHRENEEYFNAVTSVLEDYKKQNKVIEPIVKCLKAGYCS